MIDAAGLASTSVLGSAATNVLRAGKVDEVEFADFDELLALGCGFFDVDGDRKDRMRATGALVHASCGSGAGGGATDEERDDIVELVDDDFLGALDDDRALADCIIEDAQLSSIVGGCRRWVQEIAELFVIELNERHFDGPFRVSSGRACSKFCEKTLHGARDDAKMRVFCVELCCCSRDCRCR